MVRFGKRLPRFLRRYCPSPGRMTILAASNSLALLFTLADGQTGAPLNFHNKLTAEVVDEHGCSSADQSYASMTSGTYPTVHTPMFTWFPRRQATIRVRLHASRFSGCDTNMVAAECDVPNPARGPCPVWTPEPLPVVRTNGDLVFVLKDAGNLVEGANWTGPHIDILRDALPAGDWVRDA